MTDDLHDLLEQGVLGVRLKPHSREAVTLPEVFEHLGKRRNVHLSGERG